VEGEERGFEESGELAGHAAVTEEIRPVGGDFEFEEGVGIDELFHGFSDFGIRRQDE
jgi:hypothetical protein